jgi:hypothetical protein
MQKLFVTAGCISADQYLFLCESPLAIGAEILTDYGFDTPKTG